MNQVRVDCINRYLKLSFGLSELLSFLTTEKIINDFEVKEIMKEIDKGKAILPLLYRGQKNGTILLLDFEWKLLPNELVRIHIVTQFLNKEFTYSL